MTYYSGRDGSLYIDQNEAAKITNWSLSGTVDMLETTTLGHAERYYTPGLKSATGSATILYYNDAPVRFLNKVFTSDPVQEKEEVLIRLVWGPNRIQFRAYISQAEIACQVGEIMQANISFTVSGDYSGIVL